MGSTAGRQPMAGQGKSNLPRFRHWRFGQNFAHIHGVAVQAIRSATKCVILMSEVHQKFNFGWGSDPHGANGRGQP